MLDFKDHMMAIMAAAVLMMLWSATMNVPAEARPNGTVLLATARQQIRGLFPPNVWPRIIESMASEGGPIELEPPASSAPGE